MSGNTGLTAAISRSITFGESERSRADTRGEVIRNRETKSYSKGIDIHCDSRR